MERPRFISLSAFRDYVDRRAHEPYLEEERPTLEIMATVAYDAMDQNRRNRGKRRGKLSPEQERNLVFDLFEVHAEVAVDGVDHKGLAVKHDVSGSTVSRTCEKSFSAARLVFPLIPIIRDCLSHHDNKGPAA